MKPTLKEQLSAASKENIRLSKEAHDAIRKELFGVFGEGSSHPETFQITTSFRIVEKAIEGKILGHSYVSVFHNEYPNYKIPHDLEKALEEVLGAKNIDTDKHIINGVAIHF